MARVLIIDDDELTRLGLSKALEQAGVACEAVGDVREGLTRLRTQRFDGLLLDVDMTPIDGVTCLTAIRAQERLKDLPVIMMSGMAQRGIVVRIAKLGVRGLVLKNETFIRDIVRRVLDLAKEEAPGTEPESAEHAPHPHPSTTPSHDPAVKPAKPPVLEEVQQLGSGLLHLPAEPAAGAAPVSVSPAGPSAAEALETLKSLKPIIGKQELLERVLSGNELRAMGPAARMVLSLAGSESASVENVARAIKQDQAMSLRILRLANSPMYRRGAPLDSVAKAVARIGTTQIRQTILAMSVMDQFQGAGIAGRLRADHFWEHCITTGLIAAGIGRARGCAGEQVDALFTAGLLHDVGRLLFVERLGQVYAGVLDVAEKLRLPLEAVESRLLLMNHADLTDRLLREWTFPADMVAPIAYHHLSVGNIRNVAPRTLADAATLALANRLAHCAGEGSSGNDVLYPTEEFVTALNLKPAAITTALTEAGEQFGDLRATMLIHSGDSGVSARGHVRPALAGVRAQCIAKDPATNPAEHALKRLGVLAGSDAPNLLVLRVASPSERAWLLEQARGLCAQHGAALPVLALCNSQACFIEPQHLQGARVEQHLLPLQMERLEHALATLAGSAAAAKSASQAA